MFKLIIVTWQNINRHIEIKNRLKVTRGVGERDNGKNRGRIIKRHV